MKTINRTLFMACVIAGLFLLANSGKQRSGLQSEIFQTESGWGYDILANGRIFIHQVSVPSEASQKGFETKEQAEAMASLVIEKLKQKELPSVTTKEVEEIKMTAKRTNSN